MIFIEASHAQAYSNNNRAIFFDKPSDELSKAYAAMKTIRFAFFAGPGKQFFKILELRSLCLWE